MILELKVTKEQADFINTTTRTIGLWCGRRWGKSWALALRIIARAADPSYRAWFVGPLRAQSFPVLELLRDCPDLQPFIKKIEMSGNVAFPMVTFITGAKVGFRNLSDANALRSGSVDDLYLDEIQEIKSDTLLNKIFRPVLADRRGSSLIVAGQHSGPSSWQYKKLFLPGTPGKHKKHNYTSYNYPTSTGIKFQSPEGKAELAELEKDCTYIEWKQEWLCEVTEDECSVFRQSDLDEICKGGVVHNKATLEYSYIHTMDLGVRVDPTVHIVLGIKKPQYNVGPEKEKPTVVFTHERPLGEKNADGAMECARINRDFTIGEKKLSCWIDLTGAEGHAQQANQKQNAYYKDYRKQVPTMKPFIFSKYSKPETITNLQLAVEQGELHIPAHHTELLQQMSEYRWIRKKDGKIIYSCPQGVHFHDDYVTALAMAWAMFLNGGYDKGLTTAASIL
ncbi:hypothetical protein KAR91_01545 [Candidatus Pacearchaeota archaeon]|nr:hypothetical protein [Candidatus Pacearchaeota archaeon]